MPLATTEPRPQLKPALGAGGPGSGAPGRGGDGRGPEDAGGHGRRVPRRAYYTGILVGLAPILMLFAALASSYIVRQGITHEKDWIDLPLPGLIWVNTLLLVSSSVALELARRSLKRQALPGFTAWWKIGTLLDRKSVV